MANAGWEVWAAVRRMDAWLESMRGPDGYGGPVAHWWQNCLLFTGAGLDWRYEGIIEGYLALHQKTGEARWLDKARRAGDDLVRGQLPDGRFRNSSFELNPYAGGTPHEAANDGALMELAEVLRDRGEAGWAAYLDAAERNLRGFVLGVLWDGERRWFRNTSGDATFVPNKAATIVEALLRWAALMGDEELVERYARPTLEAMVECEARMPGSMLDTSIIIHTKEYVDVTYSCSCVE